MSDDHAAHAISSYGGIYDKIAPTPNIDKIGSSGIRFENVFCTNGICGPSRASILTGKYSHLNGFYKNEKGYVRRFGIRKDGYWYASGQRYGAQYLTKGWRRFYDYNF